MDSLKKHEFLDNFGETEPSLQDVFNKLIEASKEIAKIEYNDNKRACKLSIAFVLEAEKLLEGFKARLRRRKTEIAENVLKNKK